MKVYIDGSYYAQEDAKISVYDHGLLYGDGIFEGIRIYNNSVFKLQEHLKRLYQSARAILLEIPLTIEEMEKAVLDTVKENNKEDGYIRLLVTRGKGDLGINPRLCSRASVIIIVDDIQVYPEEYYTGGISVMTASTRRIAPDSLDPRIKSLNYLNNVMAKLEALQAGCMEAIMLNREGYVVECTGDNIFLVKSNVLYTPSAAYGALDGITKRTICELAVEHKIPTKEATLTLYDLYNADECFLTGTGAEIMPVIEIDKRVIGSGKPGAMTKKLKERFEQLYALS
jgi:branched-chain amino acid aminotransferase